MSLSFRETSKAASPSPGYVCLSFSHTSLPLATFHVAKYTGLGWGVDAELLALDAQFSAQGPL